ncbi:DUF433 domain-containing protein [candidate division KSB1 bacterium]|nr:DUF433 domain-containing protein [candidate division KSB1 bacterium]
MKNRIEVNPDICHGKPVISGTRIMVRNILGALAGGDSIQDILQNYPELTQSDIKAAIAYAIELVDLFNAPESNPESAAIPARALCLP